MRNPLFYAKVLLFGEYGIIENAMGLTIPLNFYKGTLKFDLSKVGQSSNENLKKFLAYLDNYNQENSIKFNFDRNQLNVDIANGLYFDSDIPQGYGVGSSGALVAAVYERYFTLKYDTDHNLTKTEIIELKDVFSQMESFFHGKSSGIDPLICYLNIPLLINSKTDISTIGIAENTDGKGAIFLINSGEPGETEPMVQIFFEKLKNDGFRKTLKEEFIKYNNACIESFVKGDFAPLFTDLKNLSKWALIHFKPMIPIRLLNLWQKGIDTNSYYLKLCGSGGGGYVLGFTKNYELAQKHLVGFDAEVIYRF